MGENAVEHLQKVSEGHIGVRFATAITAAVQTVQITAECAFPEKIRECMAFCKRMTVKAMEFKRGLLLERQNVLTHYFSSEVSDEDDSVVSGQR